LWSDSLQSITLLKSLSLNIIDYVESFNYIKVPRLSDNTIPKVELKDIDKEVNSNILTYLGLCLLGIAGIVGFLMISDYVAPDLTRSVRGGFLDSIYGGCHSIYDYFFSYPPKPHPGPQPRIGEYPSGNMIDVIAGETSEERASRLLAKIGRVAESKRRSGEYFDHEIAKWVHDRKESLGILEFGSDSDSVPSSSTIKPVYTDPYEPTKITLKTEGGTFNIEPHHMPLPNSPKISSIPNSPTSSSPSIKLSDIRSDSDLHYYPGHKRTMVDPFSGIDIDIHSQPSGYDLLKAEKALKGEWDRVKSEISSGNKDYKPISVPRAVDTSDMDIEVFD